MPRATTSPMLRYQSHGVRPRLVRPPPVEAARVTFLVEEALPIAAKDLTGPGPAAVSGRSAAGQRPAGGRSAAVALPPVHEAGQTGPQGEADGHDREQQPA